jgi:hypothetical protein
LACSWRARENQAGERVPSGDPFARAASAAKKPRCRRRAEEGKQPTRARSPYGYHIATQTDVLAGRYAPELLGTYQVVEDEATWVPGIFSRFAAGNSLRAVTRWLNENHAPTKDGKSYWMAGTLDRIIRNPVYKGEPVWGATTRRTDERRVIEHGKKAHFYVPAPEESRVQLSAPALVDAGTWQACQERMRTNKERMGGRTPAGATSCPACSDAPCVTGAWAG